VPAGRIVLAKPAQVLAVGELDPCVIESPALTADGVERLVEQPGGGPWGRRDHRGGSPRARGDRIGEELGTRGPEHHHSELSIDV
jgi:hypothetical protein